MNNNLTLAGESPHTAHLRWHLLVSIGHSTQQNFIECTWKNENFKNSAWKNRCRECRKSIKHEREQRHAVGGNRLRWRGERRRQRPTWQSAEHTVWNRSIEWGALPGSISEHPEQNRADSGNFQGFGRAQCSNNKGLTLHSAPDSRKVTIGAVYSRAFL